LKMAEVTSYPLHLCQPDGAKSCGACCGLYNWEDHSREALSSLLEKRTELFFSLGKRPDILLYRRLSQDLLTGRELCETIHNCEYLGFVDTDRKRVGCLLHPALHRGVDLRVHSFYGVDLCAGHFCPSFTYLTTMEQEAVIRAIDDWYLYGLVITDIDLVKEFFTIIQNRLGESIRRGRLGDPGVTSALHDFFTLKERWKFRSWENRLGKYYFSEAEYRIARIGYERRWGIKPSRFDKILVSLSSEFRTEEEVIEAEDVIEGKVEVFIRSYEAVSLRESR
jgi:hypothetical protein